MPYQVGEYAELLVEGAAGSRSAETQRKRPKQKYERRAGRDRSQQWRRAVQLAFLLLNVWLGADFYL